MFHPLPFLRRMFFPDRCFRCGAFDTLLCHGCFAPFISFQVTEKPSPELATLFSLSLWDERFVRELIHAWKYSGLKNLGTAFAAAAASLPLPSFDLCIPLPLHPKRFRERGFNQAEIFASALAQRMGISFSRDILARARYTQPQASLGASERSANIQGAFKIKKTPSTGMRSVLLVDDVWTTGSTMNEAARTLHSVSGLAVSGLVVAKN